MIHERASILSHRNDHACLWRSTRIFRQKTVKVDSRVLDTRTYESTTPLYPRTGNMRWCQKTDSKTREEKGLTCFTAMTRYGHAVFRCKFCCCCCLPRSYFDFIMRLSDVISVKCTMLPLISMRLSDVKENKKIFIFEVFFYFFLTKGILNCFFLAFLSVFLALASC